jgi:hypothetical protein
VRIVHVRSDGAQRREQRFAIALDRKAQRGALEGQAQLAKLPHFAGAHGEDEGAGVWDDAHEALVAKLLEGFAHRRLRDAELARKRAFGQLLTQTDIHDSLAKAIENQSGKRPRALELKHGVCLAPYPAVTSLRFAAGRGDSGMLEPGNIFPRDRHQAGGDTKALRLPRPGSPAIQIMPWSGCTAPAPAVPANQPAVAHLPTSQDWACNPPGR